MNKKLWSLIAVLGITFSNYTLAETQLIEPPMAEIPSGSFTLGQADKKDSQPLHPVTLNGFMVGKYEVTVKEFALFVADTDYQAPEQCMHEVSKLWYAGPTIGSWDKNNFQNNEFQPVTCINWQVAFDYAQWLAEKTGKPYRLLSEAEWVYAAKGGVDKAVYWSNDINSENACEFANIADKTAAYEAETQYGAMYTFDGYGNKTLQCDDKAGFISIVGMYKPNAYGLFDMSGNLAEYIQDCSNQNFESAPQDGSAWLTGNCKLRGLKGGGWHWTPSDFQARSFMPADFTGSIEGFRIAMDKPTAGFSVTTTTQLFEQQLSQAQALERNKRSQLKDINNKGVTAPKNLILEQQKNGLNKISWDKQPSVTYRVYRSRFLDGDSPILLTTELSEHYFIDPSAPSNQRAYYYVAAELGRSISQKSLPAIAPEMVLTVPGKIEAESANKQQGMIIWPNNQDKGQSLVRMNKKDWTSYRVDVKQAGKYKLTYRLSSGKAGELFNLEVNGKMIHKAKVKSTGGQGKWKNFTTEIQLNKGHHELKFISTTWQWSFDWFSLEKI